MREMAGGALDISVLISTRNRAPLLQNTLRRFRDLYMSDLKWEIIVVDNGSSDNTREILIEASRELPLIYLEESRPGKNIALNKAISFAKGGLYVFTDDDIIPDKYWLINMWEATKRWPNCSIFGGKIIPRFPSNTPDWIKSPSFDWCAHAFAKYDPAPRECEVDRAPYGPNLAIRASIFSSNIKFDEKIGPKGKNYPMGSETELLNRLKKKGEKFVYVPSAKVEHVILPHQVTLKWLLGRAKRAGRGWVRLNPDLKSKRLLGVPRYLWRMMLHRAFLYSINYFRQDQVKWKYGKEFYILLGMIQEYLIISQEKRSLRKKSSKEDNGSKPVF